MPPAGACRPLMDCRSKLGHLRRRVPLVGSARCRSGARSAPPAPWRRLKHSRSCRRRGSIWRLLRRGRRRAPLSRIHRDGRRPSAHADVLGGAVHALAPAGGSIWRHFAVPMAIASTQEIEMGRLSETSCSTPIGSSESCCAMEVIPIVTRTSISPSLENFALIRLFP